LRISIVIPSYNQASYLEETLVSIISQNYYDLDLIVIDGGSTDDSVDIIKKYNKHIAYWVSEPDNGQSHAINKGLKKATGEVFNWINSDDYLEPGSLHKIAKEFDEYKNALVVGGYCRLFFSEPDFSIISRIGVKDTPEASIIDFWMNQPSTFYRTRIIRELGGVNESFHYCMDLELWFRFLAKYGLNQVHLSRYLFSHFRHHQDSKTTINEIHFVNETRCLYAQIADELGFPKIVSKLIYNSDEKGFVKRAWDMTAINKKEFASELAERFMLEAINLGHKGVIRWFIYQLIVNGKIKLNRQFFGQIRKAFI
jgi:glycosyltransferase involved in cell wall biosynthesis